MDESAASSESVALETAEGASEALKITTKIDSPSSCIRHVVVTVPREEITKAMQKAFDDLRPRADLPGFRIGKAPRKLVEKKFYTQVADQVKSSLLMQSLQQVTEGGNFSAISEPNFDIEAIELPETGDFTYEFSIEVRPEFDTPNWKGLALKRPTHTFTEAEIERHLQRTLSRLSPSVAVDDAAKLGDVLLVNVTFSQNGKKFNEIEEVRVEVRETLSFHDALITDFVTLVSGAKEGEKRTTKVTISADIDNEAYRSQEVDVEIEIVEVSRLDVNELSSDLLEQLGFKNTDELKGYVRVELERQLDYRQQQDLRNQITSELTKDAKFDLPEDLVRRQASREIQRQVLEMQRSGFTEAQVREMANVARQNAQAMTIKALREHFILEKIAEEQKIEPTGEQYEAEIQLIAEQSEMSPRRIRARLEKTGQMDALRNQIIEREVIRQITAVASVTDFEDSKLIAADAKSFAIDSAIAPAGNTIPEAKYEDALDAKTGKPSTT
jgi:trigger factor